jgi:hypothetical protein
MNLLKVLLLKTAVAMMERRAIPKIGSFIDIVFELRQPGIQNKFQAIKGYTIPNLNAESITYTWYFPAKTKMESLYLFSKVIYNSTWTSYI